MTRPWLSLILGVSAELGLVAAAFPQLAFRNIGVPPGASQSYAIAVSPDGLSVVGSAEFAQSQPFRWTLATGFTLLSTSLGLSGTVADVANSGASVGAITTTPQGATVPVVWSSAGSADTLSFLGTSARARAIDQAELRFAGSVYDSNGTSSPCRWEFGLPTILSQTANGMGIASNGDVAINISANGPQPAIWKYDGTVLPVAPAGSTGGLLRCVAANGVVGGEAYFQTATIGFLYSEAGGVTLVPPQPPAGTYHTVLSLSADASVALVASFVGNVRTDCLWTPALGLVPLKDFLIASGLGSLSTWSSFSAADLSADGSIVVGRGTRPDGIEAAWWARLPEPKLDAVSVGPTAVQGGASAIGTVTLYGITNYRPSPTTLTSSAPEVVSVPPSVTVAKGSLTSSFAVSTVPVATTRSVVITATLRGISKTAVLTVTKDPALLSLTAPATVNGGGLGGFQVNLTAPAPFNMNVAMSSSAPLVLKVPATVAVLAGTSARAFNATGYPVLGDTLVTVTGTRVGVARTATTTVLAPRVKMITLAPTSVLGGTSSVATVTLTTPSPTGGCSVDLYSSVPSVALPPASLTVPAGATSAQATVITAPVGAQSSVTIRAKRIVTKAASLLVTP